MHDQNAQEHAHHVPEPGEPSVPQLEDDETIAPRPEEDLADLLRAAPDVTDHSHHATGTTPRDAT